MSYRVAGKQPPIFDRCCTWKQIPCGHPAPGRAGHQKPRQNLTEPNKLIFNKYLNGLSIGDAANWMDEIKGEAKYDHLRKLHYINLMKGETYNPDSKDNIVGELNRIITELSKPKNVSDEAIMVDLLELYHLMGDLHQPFHTTGEDKGGNDYQVQFNGQGTNLHSLWDSKIIEYSNIKLADVANLNQNQSKDINILEWLTQSRGEAYNATPTGHKISDDYIKVNTQVIMNQLNHAGIRLAAILNKVIGGLNPNPAFPIDKVEVVEISIDSVNRYKGQTVRVCTLVKSTKQIENGSRPLLLSVGEEYPYNPLTVVIFNEDLETFKLNREKDYKGKKLCVTGKIVEYQGKLQIVVKRESQLEIH